MAYERTGYKRSLKVSVVKTIDGVPATGYSKQYPTATDIANGYFTLFGNQYDIPTDEELGYLSQEEYDLLLLRFKQYVLLNEPGLSFSNDIVNEPEIYAPDECYQTTTTTTPIPVTTTTTTIFGDCVEYGLLYNWYAATDERNIANNGWRLPSLSDATNLINYVGEHGGGNLKNVGFIYWDEPNTGATNELNFNAKGTGGRGDDGSFWDLKIATYIWNNDNGVRYTIEMDSYDNLIVNNQRNSSYEAVRGAAIRLIKDVTTLTHGQIGTYTGNDGKIYQTICIGTQEWLADYLVETKFRNGDIIPFEGANPGYFTNAEWGALATPGVCAYNNDLANVGCDFEWPTE